MGVAKVTSKLSEFHYPDRLHRALMINAPGSINHMWGVVKPLLDTNAQERTSVFTTPHTYKVRTLAVATLCSVPVLTL